MSLSAIPNAVFRASRRPLASDSEIGQVLISAPRIQRRVRQLAALIETEFARRDLVVVALLSGTVFFLADLLRAVSLPLQLDFLGVSSYRGKTVAGKLVFTSPLRLDIQDRDVLVIDDILDTGRTLSAVIDKLSQLAPRRLRTCVLLDKPARRTLNIHADYTGFRIPDAFVVGYGLDYSERYRNLPFIGVLKPEYYQQGEAEDS